MIYKNIKLSASIMCIDWMNVKAQINDLQNNKIDYLHFDILDGVYAHDFTMGSSIINCINKNTNIPSHYHLMVEEPLRIFDRFKLNKNDIFTIHQETSKNLHKDLIEVKKHCKVSVALAPATPVEYLEYVIEDVDDVLILTVNPGFMSQKVIPQITKKIEKVKELILDLSLKTTITVDGNVNKKTIPNFLKAGANILVLGSSGLFIKDMKIEDALNEVRETIYKAE
tara:strand:+ start:1022 stop:1699 length:678 start_codon:yes stop_codon:yes gene_type:complete